MSLADGVVSSMLPDMSTIQSRRPEGAQASLFPLSGLPAAVANPNAAQVLKVSPFRYPGGKSWFVPDVKAWLRSRPTPAKVFVEPFAGGASVSLNVAASGVVPRVVMSEIDGDVAAVWSVALRGSDAAFERLCESIRRLEVSRDAVTQALSREPTDESGRAFRTILRNRMSRDGNLTPGAGLIGGGEAGRGLASRWYPTTLVRRLRSVRALAGRIDFVHGSAFDVIAGMAGDGAAAFFVDPPYTAGGCKVGSRLYPHSQVDHEGLFASLAQVRGPVLMTYDDVPEVVRLADAHGFAVDRVPMSGTQRRVKWELVVTRDASGA